MNKNGSSFLFLFLINIRKQSSSSVVFSFFFGFDKGDLLILFLVLMSYSVFYDNPQSCYLDSRVYMVTSRSFSLRFLRTNPQLAEKCNLCAGSTCGGNISQLRKFSALDVRRIAFSEEAVVCGVFFPFLHVFFCM